MAAALDLLKQKRKRLEQEQKKMLAGLEKRKEELETKISVLRRSAVRARRICSRRKSR